LLFSLTSRQRGNTGDQPSPVSALIPAPCWALTSERSVMTTDPYRLAGHNQARVYDDLGGGKDALAPQRKVAQNLTTHLPGLRDAVRDNRAFLDEAVVMLARGGIDQFIDLGAGFPRTGPNLHHIAREHAPDARMVYVDYDVPVVAHWRAQLKGYGLAAVERDARRPVEVLSAYETQMLIDIDRPVGLIMGLLLHFWTDEELQQVLDIYLQALASGSGLVISHATTTGLTAEQLDAAVKEYEQPIYPRSEQEITALFDGVDLMPPGVVAVRDWPLRRIDDDKPPLFLGGVALIRDRR